MTVALLLAAAPDRLSAMAQPYRQPGDRTPGAPPWIEFVGGRLMSAGVRQVDVAMCAGAADGLRAVAATVRDIDEPILVCTTTRALATPGGALAALAGGTGTATAALAAAGALLVASKDLPAVADAAEALASRIGPAGSAGGRVRGHGLLRRTRVSSELNGAVDSLIEYLSGNGVHVMTVGYPEPGVNGRAAPVPGGTVNGVRPSRRAGQPGLLATFAVGPLAGRIARWAAARTLAQTALATAALALAVCAAAWYAHGTRSSLITGSLLLAVALPLRQAAALSPSPLAEWLAAVPGTAAEYAVYAALAASWTTGRPHRAWVFATTAMVLLAVRQMTDDCYSSVAGTRPPVGPGHRLLRLSGQSIAFPLAERTALIAVTVPVWGPRTALIILIGWGVVALGYSLAERVLGSRSLASAPAGPATPARPRGTVRDDGIG
jgi:hypothetical protein